MSTSICRCAKLIGIRSIAGLAIYRWFAANFGRVRQRPFDGNETPASVSSVSIWARTSPKHSAPSPERCHAPLKPDKAFRLTKIEAEDLLDLLEGVGYGLCDLSYADGEGFSVRLPVMGQL
jgi:hypothetical protein